MGTGRPGRGAAWLLLLLLLPPPAAHTGELYCSLPNPRNVHFESINMKNVLHWSAPEGTGDGVLYKVKYLVYGVGKWIRKPECRNINRTWCDLSSETSDYEEQYYASVKAFLNGMCSAWIETTRFNPLTDTKIDPPVVNVSSTEKSISIILTAPEKWKRSSEGESITLLQVYPGLQYNVSVLNKKTKKRMYINYQAVPPSINTVDEEEFSDQLRKHSFFCSCPPGPVSVWQISEFPEKEQKLYIRKWFFSVSNNTLVVPHLEPGTSYCISAQIYVTTPLLHSGFSKEYCIATLKDKTADETVTVVFGYVLPIMLAVLFISMTCYCVHRYIHVSKQKHPANLVWHYTDKCKGRVFIPCEKIVVNLITVNGDEYKPFPESSHLSERKSPCYYTVYNGTEAKDLTSKEVLETKHFLDISHEEISCDILAERDQTGNGPSYGQHGTKNTLRQNNTGTVEYEHDIRTEDVSPDQKLEDLNLKEKTSAPKGLLGKTQISLGDLIDTGQLYCPQLEMWATDPCLGQKIEELNLKVVDAADELPSETHINLLDLDTLKSGQTSYAQLEIVAQDLTEKEGGQMVLIDWDPHTGRLYIPTLSSVENQVCEGVFKCDDPDKEGILSRLYEKEISDESSEDQEMSLLQFKEQWGLHVKMEG